MPPRFKWDPRLARARLVDPACVRTGELARFRSEKPRQGVAGPQDRAAAHSCSLPLSGVVWAMSLASVRDPGLLGIKGVVRTATDPVSLN